MNKILLILYGLVKFFIFWDKENNRREGEERLAKEINEAHDEKIKKANTAAAGDLPDELLLDPKNRGKK